MLAHETGELGVVPDTVQEGVEEDSLAIRTESAHDPRGEFQRLVPIDIRS